MTKTPIAVLGIDLGKNSCSLAGMDAAGSVVMRKRMTRDAIVTFAATLPTCIIAMEACCAAHFLGRTLALYGHTIRLMSPEYVQPYVKAQKPTTATPRQSPKRQRGRRCALSRSRAMTNSICKSCTACGSAWSKRARH